MTRIFDPMVLDGKRILITGGGTGLGRGVAASLAAHGAQVHLWGRRETVLADAAAEISAAHPGAVHYQTVNVREFDQVAAAVGEIWDRHGPLTGLLNNAAANFIAPTVSLSPRAFEAVTSTVMTGSFNTTLAIGKRWIAEGLRGSVLSNLTTWVWSGSAFVVPSAMAKAAVHAMTMSLAVEWGPHDYAWEVLNPTDKSSIGATQPDQIPLGRSGTIDELSNLTIFAFSDACDYLTGETIAMDGGQRLAGPNTFAGLSAMSEDDWARARERSTRASAAAKSARSV
jgi:NAD(P)-dependent dehydrogenase (short-subunit alcohol dehydrogenase family)